VTGYGGQGVKPCGRLATGVNPNGSTDNVLDAKVTCALGGGHVEVHCYGEVWAQGLINLMNDLPLDAGVPPIAKDVLASQFLYSRGESYKDAVDHLIDSDETLYSGANVAAICQEMEIERGIAAASCD
jgi:hypothetical protein